jgi:hypothetical protein
VVLTTPISKLRIRIDVRIVSPINITMYRALLSPKEASVIPYVSPKATKYENMIDPTKEWMKCSGAR